MRFHFFQLLILLLPLSVPGQDPDSLWQQFQDESQPLKERLVSLHRMSRLFMYNNPDSAYRLAEQEYAFAADHADSSFMASALNLQGGILTVKNDFAGAIDKFYRMLDIRLALQDTIGTAGAYNNIGNVYYHKGDYARALEHYIRSLHYEQMAPSDEGLATSYINIGSVYALQDEFTRALDYFKRALQLYEENQELSGIASCYSNMGNLYRELDSLQLAEEYFLKAIPMMKTLRDDYSLAVAYGNLAAVYRVKGDFDAMLDHYYRSEQLRRSVGDQVGLARVWLSRGMAYEDVRRYEDMRNECQKALALSEGFGALGEMKDACDCLYLAYKGLNNNEIALTYFERVNALEDSMSNDETRTQLRLMEFRAEVSADSVEREQEKLALAALHEKELRRGSLQRNLFIVIAILLLITVIGAFRVARRLRKSKDKSDQLLLSVLPADVARELKEKGRVEAREFANVTVLFTDFVEFTHHAETMKPQEMLDELNVVYRKFDEIAARHNIRKIKSIGDAYMAAGGLPVSSPETVRQTVLAALDMQSFLHQHNVDRTARGKEQLLMRAGLHTGSVIAGIAGFHNFQYDIWGDSVNLASRLERHGAPGRVNVSRTIYDVLKDHPSVPFTARGTVEVKGKGPVEMWFVTRNTQAASGANPSTAKD